MVSVIVPAYNVERYIDRCLESIIGQTYTDLEIILLNDGSTDGTDSKCLFWKERDPRIIYISKNNEGLGSTRNRGLEVANGEYICFVDTDDWLERDCIEKMIQCMETSNFDFCMVQSCYVDQRARKVLGFEHIIHGELNYLKRKLAILFLPPSAWGKLYRHKFLQRINYFQPSIIYEDTAAFPYLILKAERIGQVHEPLYNYQVDNEESIMHRWDFIPQLPLALEWARNKIIECGELDYYEEVLKTYALKQFDFQYRNVKNKLDKDNLYKFVEVPFVEYLNKYHVGWKEEIFENYYIWGSFALSWLVRYLMTGRGKKRNHQPFSSIISQFLGNGIQCAVQNVNEFRKNVVDTDMKGNFFDLIDKEKCDLRGKRILFLDFMEERYHLLCINHEEYITCSDAWKESRVEWGTDARVTAVKNEKQRWNLWKQACDSLTAYLETAGFDRIVLVRSRLSYYYMEDGKRHNFEDFEAIEVMNAMFERMETYFLDRCKGVREVNLPENLL